MKTKPRSNAEKSLGQGTIEFAMIATIVGSAMFLLVKGSLKLFNSSQLAVFHALENRKISAESAHNIRILPTESGILMTKKSRSNSHSIYVPFYQWHQ